MLVFPCVSFVLPFCLHIPDDIYDVFFEDEYYLVKTVFIINKGTAHAPFTSTGRWEIHHDTFGRTGNTQFHILSKKQIRLSNLNLTEKEVKGINLSQQKGDEYINNAVRVGNRILEVYRDQDKPPSTGEPSFHIFPVTNSDISGTCIYFVNNEYKTVAQAGERGYGGLLSISGRDPEVIKEIKDMLTYNTPVPFWRVLIRSAQNWLWREDYRLVPIEANSAFEFVINNIMNNYMAMLNNFKKPTTLLDKLIHVQKLANQNRSNIGKKEVEWAPENNSGGWKSFISIIGRQEVANWYKYCYLLRNKVIHDGLNNVLKADAELALTSTESAIEFLFELDQI